MIFEPRPGFPINRKVVLVVTGSRNGHPFVEQSLDNMYKEASDGLHVFVGDADGVDKQARDWFRFGKKPVSTRSITVFDAKWSEFDLQAGPIRNTEMVHAAMLRARELHATPMCLAFPSSDSRGTWDCVRKASISGFDVLIEHPQWSR